MAMRLKTSVAELKEWINLQSKPLKWAVAVDIGRIELDAWSEFIGIEALPRGIRCIIRAVDGKGGIHFLLDKVEGTQQTAMIAPVEAAMRQQEAIFKQKMEEMKQWEQRLIEDEKVFLREKNLAMAQQVTISQKLDERSASIANNLKQLEESVIERNRYIQELLSSLDQALSEKADAQSSQAVAASITYATDRLMNSLMLWKVKSIKDIPETLQKSFQEFMQLQASRKFFECLPDGPRKWANQFMDLPDNLRAQTMEAISAAAQDEANMRARNEQGAQAV